MGKLIFSFWVVWLLIVPQFSHAYTYNRTPTENTITNPVNIQYTQNSCFDEIGLFNCWGRINFYTDTQTGIISLYGTCVDLSGTVDINDIVNIPTGIYEGVVLDIALDEISCNAEAYVSSIMLEYDNDNVIFTVTNTQTNETLTIYPEKLLPDEYMHVTCFPNTLEIAPFDKNGQQIGGWEVCGNVNNTDVTFSAFFSGLPNWKEYYTQRDREDNILARVCNVENIDDECIGDGTGITMIRQKSEIGFKNTTGETFGGVVTWTGNNIIKVFLGGAFAVLLALRFWIVALVILYIVVYFYKRAHMKNRI